jgi:hypothetical protein
VKSPTHTQSNRRGCSEGSLSLYDLADSDSPWRLFAIANPSDVPIRVDDFLGFPYLSALAKISILLVCFASEILENLDFPVYFCELARASLLLRH